MAEEQKIKTVFITSFFGLIGRNILATNTLKALRNHQDLRIVILTAENKQVQYQKIFGGGNVIVEGVKVLPENWIDGIARVFFNNFSDTAAWRIHRLISRKQGRWFLAPIYWLVSKLGHWYFVRKLARWVDFYFLSHHRYADYFYKYRPSLFFATDVFHPVDVDFIKTAKLLKVRTLGMVRSWDNITTKGLNRVVVDRLVVNTKNIQDEAVQYNDYSLDDVAIVVVPHYDDYVVARRNSREEVLKKLGLDFRKKTIFFAPPSDIYSENNPISIQVIRALSKLDGVQLLIRLYIVGKASLGDLQQIPGRIAIDDPGSSDSFTDVDLTAGDSHLADLLYHSDVVVSFASTLAVDAVVFNRPVVFIGFDGDSRAYWKSLRRFYDYDHQQNILKTGGVKLAKNIEELVGDVKKYLDNPSLDEAGRKKIIEERCWKLDGKSGERLANIILDNLE